jgi:hypothetical protein
LIKVLIWKIGLFIIGVICKFRISSKFRISNVFGTVFEELVVAYICQEFDLVNGCVTVTAACGVAAALVGNFSYGEFGDIVEGGIGSPIRCIPVITWKREMRI